MTTQAKRFIWYELVPKDQAAAAAFYSSVFGWTTQEYAPGTNYQVISAQGHGLGGITPAPTAECAGIPGPVWIGYMGVDDVDACIASIVAAGGAVVRPAFDLPGVGRIAMVRDNTGASFCLMKGAHPEPMTYLPVTTPGTIDWHELHADDGPKAWEFYSSHFGWEKDFAMDMGPMGVYQTYKMGDGGVGGMMTKMPDCPSAFWLFYVAVEALDAAIERVNAGGGKVIMGPHQVPGGQWIAQCVDPQGAMFAMVSGVK